MLLKAILKLTRWQEFVPFTILLSLLGGLVAYQVYDAELDGRLLIVTFANLAAVSYAFMVNDIEDAPDDARDPARGARNPVTMNEISIRTAWIASFIVAGLALIAYALSGTIPFLLGTVTVILAHLYSWKPVRLKARRLVDILSHALFLSTLLFLAPFYLYADNLGKLWVLAVVTFLASANGQFYNQVRDFDMDRAAGLHNTASVIGKRFTDYLAKGSVLGSVLGVVISVFQGVFPLWLGIVLVIVGPIVLYLFRNYHKDMRGSDTTDPVAEVQVQALIILNTVMVAWLLEALI